MVNFLTAIEQEQEKKIKGRITLFNVKHRFR